jgi:transitional endoplasmic reticulum ATPase
MAKSLAKESGFNVIQIRGPELLSKYMGESERNFRELFRQARQMAPTIVILDGIDSLATSGGSDSKFMERVVNQLAMEMNSNSGEKPIVVVATAARPEDVPPVLRATGRFGHKLMINPPNSEDRALLFEMYLNKDRVAFSGDYATAAKESEGLTGGDIEDVCRRVILRAARHALERDSDTACEVVITGDDLVKLLDRWKLTRGGRHSGV